MCASLSRYACTHKRDLANVCSGASHTRQALRARCTRLGLHRSQVDLLALTTMESLPVELIAEILGELDLPSLIITSYLSRRLNYVASDSSLNPWRGPILRCLLVQPGTPYEPSLRSLSERSTVPRQNWIEILSMARADWLLLEATLPSLRDSEWEECFKRRFLPSWRKWKGEDEGWGPAFRKYAVLREWCVCLPRSCAVGLSWQNFDASVAPEHHILHYG